MMRPFQSFLYGLAGVTLLQASIVSALDSGQVFAQRDSAPLISQPASVAHAGSMLAGSANPSKTSDSLRPPFVRSSHRFTLPSQSASTPFGTTTPPVIQPSERLLSSILTSNTRMVDFTTGRQSSVLASGQASEKFGTGASPFQATSSLTSGKRIPRSLVLTDETTANPKPSSSDYSHQRLTENIL